VLHTDTHTHTHTQTFIFFNFVVQQCNLLSISLTCSKISNHDKARWRARGKRTIWQPYGYTLNKQNVPSTKRSARPPFIFQCFRAFSLLYFLRDINGVEGCLLWTLSYCRRALCVHVHVNTYGLIMNGAWAMTWEKPILFYPIQILIIINNLYYCLVSLCIPLGNYCLFDDFIIQR